MADGDTSWQTLSGHLDRVMDLPDGERAGYLSGLAATDPQMARQLSDLLALAQRHEFGRFLADSPPFQASDFASSALIGRTVGAYRIEAEIGRGGMGSVWRARRIDDRFESTVAIKIIHAAWLGGAGEQRFRLEGRVLSRLDHLNIARLLDAGLLDGAQPYLVLEYVRGEPIDRYCERNKLDARARIKLFLDVLAAVSHAHSHLIVHRDIKPANVFVTDAGTVKLLDFGIARLVAGDEAASTALTRSSLIPLTPQYASPEQLLAQPVTTATDVYALGLVLYVLATGTHPVASESASSAEWVRAVVTDEPALLSKAARIPGIEPRALRGDLDNIVAKALRKNPADRYGSVDAFADDLRRFLENEPVQARPDSAAYRFSKFVRRHRRGVAAAGLLIVVLAGATMVTFLQKQESDRQRNVAQLETRYADAETEFLHTLLQSDGGSGQKALTASERIDLGVHLLDSQYGDDPRFAGRMLIQLSRQLIGQDKTKQAVALDTKAYELGKRAHDPELMAFAQCKATYAEANAGILDRASQRIGEARRLMAGLSEPPVLLQVSCDQAESEAVFKRGDAKRAEALLRHASALLEKSGETFRTEYCTVLNDLTDILNEQSRFQEALVLLHTIGAIHERFGRGATAARLMALQNESIILMNMGEIQASLTMLDEVRRRLRAIQGEAAEPLSLEAAYAEELRRLGRDPQALALALSTRERAQKSGHFFWFIMSLQTACAAYLDEGQVDAAESVLKQAVDAAKASAQQDVYLRGTLDMLRSKLELRRGNTVAALNDARTALAALGPDSNDVREALDLAASAERSLARLDESAAHAQHALQIADSRARGPQTSADVGEALLMLAKVRISQGKSAEAQPLLQRAVQCLTNALGADHKLSQEARGLVARST